MLSQAAHCESTMFKASPRRYTTGAQQRNKGSFSQIQILNAEANRNAAPVMAHALHSNNLETPIP